MNSDQQGSKNPNWKGGISRSASRYRDRFRKKFPQKAAAHRAVSYALQIGQLKRGPCAKCGATEDVHAHHHDYRRHLDVTWLCRACHRKEHAEHPQTGAGDVSPGEEVTKYSFRDRGRRVLDWADKDFEECRRRLFAGEPDWFLSKAGGER